MCGLDHNNEGCSAVIYDENGNYITKTFLRGFRKTDLSISIRKDTPGVARGTRLVIMIMHSNETSEYNGIARGIIYDMREISLFKRQHAKGRGDARFAVDAPAVVKTVIVNANKITLPIPQNVRVVNISKSGILLSSVINFFEVGVILEISMNFNGKDTLLIAQVKREMHNEDGSFSYGCKLIQRPT